MKRFAVMICLLMAMGLYKAAGQSLRIPNRPLPERKVNDFAHVLLPGQQKELEEKLQQYEKLRHVDMLVVLMNTIDGKNIQHYADSMMKKWKIGDNTEGRGLLMFVDLKSKEVFISIAKGLKRQLIQATTFRVINHDIAPAFEQQHYYEGVNNGIDALNILLIPLHELQTYTDAYNTYHRNILIGILVLVFGSGIVLYLAGRTKS